MQVDLCRLCLREEKLQASHVIPKFAVDWIKETSATGYLRAAARPNRRIQDIAKIKLLCRGCEELLSKDEKRFAERVFYPFVNGAQVRFQYGEWLRRFAVSLAWRVAMASPPLGVSEGRNFQQALEVAAGHWRAYLLGLASSPGPYTHHMFLGGYVEEGTSNVPKGLQTYLTRSVDSTMVIGKRKLLTYAKLPSVIFACHILPPAIPGWKRTRILRNGEIGTGLELCDDPFVQFLVERAQMPAKFPLSPKQSARMETDVLKDPDRALASESYRAYLAEKRFTSQNPTELEQ